MKVAVVMTYYKREFQLKRTLLSLEQSTCKDFVVIVVDDASEENLVLPETSYQCDLITIRKEDKTWQNPEPAYNFGILKALSYSPEIIIIQNAECLHIGDVISYAADHITENNYIPFKCLALDETTTFDPSIDLVPLTQSIKHGESREGELAWYHHPTYRNCNLEFCAAISAKNMVFLNGYDERFMYGVSYGDNFWLHRINIMGLEIETPDSPMVAHQWHFYPWYWERMTSTRANLNAALYNSLMIEHRRKAEHLITPDFENIIN